MKLQDLYKITILQKAIYKLKEKSVYEVCAITKMRNKTNNKVSERKLSLLDLISINIYGLLPTILSGTQYFLKIVNNHIKKS
jgi:hypothetical protein